MEIETLYIPIYEGVPLFPEVDSFMRSQGFQIHDLKTHHWKRRIPGVGFDSSIGDLIEIEVLYFRSTVSIIEMVRCEIATVQQALQCYLAYGYTHLSEALVALASSEGLLDLKSRQASRQLVQRFRRSRALSWLPEAQRIKWRILHLTERLAPHYSWDSVSKAELGSR